MLSITSYITVTTQAIFIFLLIMTISKYKKTHTAMDAFFYGEYYHCSFGSKSIGKYLYEESLQFVWIICITFFSEHHIFTVESQLFKKIKLKVRFRCLRKWLKVNYWNKNSYIKFCYLCEWFWKHSVFRVIHFTE